MLHVNVDRYHTTNRTATTNGPISLAYAAGLGKYGYGNVIVVTERISGTVLMINYNYINILFFKQGSADVCSPFKSFPVEP